jgi:hypothetical protein
VGRCKGFDEHSGQIGFSQQNDTATPPSLMSVAVEHSAQCIVTEGSFFEE